jgi:hypothetical protein
MSICLACDVGNTREKDMEAMISDGSLERFRPIDRHALRGSLQHETTKASVCSKRFWGSATCFVFYVLPPLALLKGNER